MINNPALKSAGAILLSVLVALLLLSAIEGISAVLHPFPADFDQTYESMAQHVANYPAWVLFLLGGIGWGLTALAASFLATRFGARRHPAHGMAIGILLVAAAAFNISMLPYPNWFVLVDVVLLPLGVYLGVILARAGTTASSS
ncbi:MAG: hypothetical protein R3F41_07815 [Gammaproteobacteria bacterium]|nr:hypothetical protein [Pseudomonadales bacterium]MCP5349265.1 hypothetical protein [Pseudomonadales bacterium]